MNLYKQMLVICSLVAITACQNNEQTSDAHSHDDVTVPYTGYSDEMEVFADIQPLAVGNTSQLIIHFTDLKTFKPINASSLTVMLNVGGKVIRIKSDKPTRQGIFKMLIQPVVSGIGKIEFDLDVNGQSKRVSIDSIEVYADAHDAVHLAEQLIPSSPNAISFTKEQSWKVNFRTDLPIHDIFNEVIKAPATIEYSPVNRRIIAARSSGFAQFSSGILAIGQSTKAKEWLMTISGEGLSENNSQVKLQEAKVEYDVTKAEYERDLQLKIQKIVSEKELLESKSAYEKAKAKWDNLQKTISIQGEKVLASGNGYIESVKVNNGQYVEAGMPLISIVQHDKMKLTAMVRQSHAPALKHLIDANVESSNGTVYPLSALNGKIVAFGQVMDAKTHLLPVTLELDHHEALIGGGFAKVYLKSSKGTAVIAVPESAITETQGLYFVYLQLTPELFERRQVTVGASDGINRVITSGLKPNERIVTQGAILVKLAAVSNTVDPHAGHVH